MAQKTFKDRLGFLLKHYNIRVMTLDAKAGLYHGQTGSFMRGDTEPKLSTIIKLKKFFKDVSLDWLVLGKGKAFEK
jgi:hypothetical protein